MIRAMEPKRWREDFERKVPTTLEGFWRGEVVWEPDSEEEEENEGHGGIDGYGGDGIWEWQALEDLNEEEIIRKRKATPKSVTKKAAPTPKSTSKATAKTTPKSIDKKKTPVTKKVEIPPTVTPKRGKGRPRKDPEAEVEKAERYRDSMKMNIS